VLIVCSYLLANFPNVAITAWEYLDLDSTQSEHYYDVSFPNKSSFQIYHF